MFSHSLLQFTRIPTRGTIPDLLITPVQVIQRVQVVILDMLFLKVKKKKVSTHQPENEDMS
jgi:hypothetical protein